MIETMPNKLFKFLETNPEYWEFHEKLDPNLTFKKLTWDNSFAWNLDSNFGCYLDYLYYYLDLCYYIYLDSNPDFIIDYLNELCISCEVLE